jgi:2-C-methyl-D-erythritol 4-phosphate cytidylyltransferase / 2-C-methyl-D-erythritol 2,4-cyclodiphosphate synthase
MEIKSRLYATRADAVSRLRDLLGTSSQSVAVIPAAGKGERSGLSIPKQYHRLAGKTMLSRSVLALAGLNQCAAVVVVLHPDDCHWMSEGLDAELANCANVVAVTIGGASRRDSVLAGCMLIQDALVKPDVDNPWVLVHDAARPGVDNESLRRLWTTVTANQHVASGGILAMPIADTIKRVAARNDGHTVGAVAPAAAKATATALSNTVPVPMVSDTLDRSLLWAAQTPQMFLLRDLLAAYQSAPQATDEASAIEAAGGRVLLVMGNATNTKLTQPDDFQMMEAVMAKTIPVGSSSTSQGSPTPVGSAQLDSANSALPLAVGQGFDVHALVVGRPLIIGGVTIPYDKGLDGHSDADVLLHAITDAILGAASMGDIGRHFPDTDPAFKGADSKRLLREAVDRVQAKGWRVAQIDTTIIAQAPKISPYAAQMQTAIGQCCDLAAERINIKGKTTEKLGFTGRGEGIAAQAIAMLVRATT